MPEAQRPEISVVVPMHNEEQNARPLYQELTAVLERLGRPYEILFVNDGSTDRTLEVLLELVREDPRFGAISTWDLRRYNRAQIDKVYRIKAVHRQGTAGG